MPKYYIDKKADSDSEYVIHRKGCNYLEEDDEKFLGCFSNYYDAVEIAKIRGYQSALSCSYCSSGYLYDDKNAKNK